MMAKKRVIKNPDAPGGRKDWIGRTPRERFQATAAELAILMEWAQFYETHSDKGRFDPRHHSLMLKIRNAQLRIQKPLTEEVYDAGLFGADEIPDFGVSDDDVTGV